MINIQNIDGNECFKWCYVRYLNPVDHHRARITKDDKYFSKKVDFRALKLPVKTRDIYKIEKTNSISISVFDYKNQKRDPIYVSKKCCEKKHVDLLLMGQRHDVLIKDFNTFIRGRKHFCRYCLEAFSTEEILKSHIKDCFKIDDKQRILMPKKDEYIKFKNHEKNDLGRF